MSPFLCVSLTPHLPLTSSQGQRWHLGSEPFGRPWQSGDVVGCMIDLTENTIIFTLNGEVLMSDSGSETAFREIEVGDGKGWPRGPFLVFFHLTLHCIPSLPRSILSFHSTSSPPAPTLPTYPHPCPSIPSHQASCLSAAWDLVRWVT